nr:unnamed protein product [Naegleria fowleri]
MTSSPLARKKPPPRGHAQAPSPFFFNKQQEDNNKTPQAAASSTTSPLLSMTGSLKNHPHPSSSFTTPYYQQQQQQFSQQEHYDYSNIFLNHQQHVIIPLSTPSFSLSTTPSSIMMIESTPISPSRSRLSSKLGGELTVGEIEGEMIHISSPQDQLISYYCNRGGVIYPNIIIPHVLHDEEEQSDPTTSTTPPTTEQYEKFSQPWNGKEESEFNSSSSPFTSLHHLMNHTTTLIYEYLQHFTRYFPYMQSMVSMKVPSCMMMMDSNISLRGVKCMDWHPFLMRMAILLHDDHIYFYNVWNEEWSAQVLRHEFQFNVSMIKYKPNRSNESVLAVACENGILIWDVNGRLMTSGGQSIGGSMTSGGQNLHYNDSNGYTKKDVSRNGICIFLPSSSKVNCISWGVDESKTLLASSSLFDHRVFIYSHERNGLDWKLFKVLTKFNGGVRMVEFSPDSKYLFVSHITNVFRVYETRNFDFCEKWSCFDRPVKSMAWHGSEYLFIVTEDSDCIHVLRDETSYLMSGSGGGGNSTTTTNSTTTSGGGGGSVDGSVGMTSGGGGGDEFHFEYQCKIPLSLYSPYKTHQVKCCGKIRQIQVHGERLIVSFEQSPLLAVIQMDCSSRKHFICRPMGYIRGPTPKLLSDTKKRKPNIMTTTTHGRTLSERVNHNVQQPVYNEQQDDIPTIMHDDENSNTSSSDIFTQAIEESTSNGYHLQFWNNFEKGSLLSVCWKGIDKDKISIYPFYYHVTPPQWNALYDENNPFYRSRLHKNIERQQQLSEEEEDDDEPIVSTRSHGTPFNIFDD